MECKMMLKLALGSPETNSIYKTKILNSLYSLLLWKNLVRRK